MTTKNKEHYMTAWIAQVSQFNTLHYPLIEASKKTPHDFYAEIKELQQRLRELVEIAANNEFQENPMDLVQEFVLDGITGYVYKSGFIKIGPIACNLSALEDCKLKNHAQMAYDKLMEKLK
jgi:hypothetical protein